ncbi:MAG: hypothetical protein GEU97_06830 [Actinophytocola sp.]|nr:hypothetical protein [Actinophytocola sp.]
MTDSNLPAGGGSRSWTVDELAEMQAGALADATAAEMWSRVRHDPDAMAVLDALDTTKAELAGLREAPVPPMPDDVAARIDTALAAERQQAFPAAAPAFQGQPPIAPPPPPHGQPGQVVDMAQARRKRAKQLGWGTGLLTAAAAAVAVVVLSLPSQSTKGTPLAEDPASQSSDQPLSLRGDDLASGTNKTIGVENFGPFENRAGLDACLDANDLTIDNDLLGVRPATVDGREAVLAVFTTGALARYRLLAFPASCGKGNPGIIYDEVVGG